MRKEFVDTFRILAILISILLAIHIVGCGADDAEDVPVNFVSVTPPGGEIGGNATITLTFDNIPTGVTSTAGNVTVVGKSVVIEGPFKSGDLKFTVAWVGGSRDLTFYVTGV